jgi:hypothetical protein
MRDIHLINNLECNDFISEKLRDNCKYEDDREQSACSLTLEGIGWHIRLEPIFLAHPSSIGYFRASDAKLRARFRNGLIKSNSAA